MKTYLVGGAVRDQLLGQEINERDWVVVGATPEALLNLGYRPVGKDFPVFLHPKTHEEYALARTERKTGPGYKGFSFYTAPDVSLEQDLSRRDLTINALAQDPDTGEIIDPYRGLQDLQQRILRHVSPAFREDPVRILRIARFAARFATLGFQIAPETLALMQDMVINGEVNALVAERVWQELVRALHEPTPAEFFRALLSCNALSILFPALAELFTISVVLTPQTSSNLGEQCLLLLQQAALMTTDSVVRFAVLTRSFGQTTSAPETNHLQLESGIQKIKALGSRYRIPHQYIDLALLTRRFYPILQNALQLPADELLVLLEKTDALRRPARFTQLAKACLVNFEGFKQNEFKYLQTAAQCISKVEILDLVKTVFEGHTLAELIRARRLAILTKFLTAN